MFRKEVVLLAALVVLLVPLRAAFGQKAWALLVYLNGDNDLWWSALEDFNEMEVEGSGADFDVVVQIDLPELLRPGLPFSDTRRYYINRDPGGMNETFVSTQVWPETGMQELDMGDPATLSDFLLWAVDSYPAERYAIVIWDHGDGWRAAGWQSPRRPLKAISDDFTSGSSISVSEGELSDALASVVSHLGRRLDIVALDACLMGMWEVATVLKGFASYILYSQDLVDSSGYDYVALLGRLASDPLQSERDLCAGWVLDSIESVGSTLSCVDSSMVDPLSAAVDSLALSIIAAAPSVGATVSSAASRVMRFGGEFADLHSFARRLAQMSALPDGLRESAALVQQAVDGAVVLNATRGAGRGARGISIYLPVQSDPLPYDPAYSHGRGALWSAYHWDEMLCSLLGIPCAPDLYEPDGEPELAKMLGPDDPLQQRSLFPPGDIDFARVAVWEGVEYSFYTFGEMDTYLQLYGDLDGDGDLDRIAYDDDGGKEYNAHLFWTSDFDGTVFVEVQHYGSVIGWGPETGHYLLGMTWEECNPQIAPVCKQEGICRGTRRSCEGEGEWVCLYPEGYSEREISCDGIDEDCDGLVDEDTFCGGCELLEWRPCLRLGVCAGTRPECTEEGWSCQYPASYSEGEDKCDGLDNDCDGLLDEDEPMCGGDAPLRVMGAGLACSLAMVR